MSRQADDIISLGLSWENLFIPMFLVLLPFVAYILPIAFLFGTMIAFLRLSMDSELTAFRAAGASLKKIVLPVLWVGLAVSLIGTLCAAYLDPLGRANLQKFFYEQAQTQLDQFLRVQLQPKVFSDSFFGMSFYAEHINDEHSEFRKIIIGPVKNDKVNQFAIYAKEGKLTGAANQGDLTLNLYDGVVHSYSSVDNKTTITQFESTRLGLVSLFRDSFVAPKFNEEDYNFFLPAKLHSYYKFQEKKIKELKQKKSNEDYSRIEKKMMKDYYEARFLFFHRFGISFIVISLGVLGMCAGIQGQRSARNFAYIQTVIAFVLCYSMLMFFKQLGTSGVLHPFFAIFIPWITVSLIACIVLFWKERTPQSEPFYKVPLF